MYVVMINGHVACLKTTLSYLLAPPLKLAHISTSVLGHFDPRRHTPKFFPLRETRYRIAGEIASHYLNHGVSIILDGTYALRKWRNQIYNIADNYNAEDVVALTCTCSNLECLNSRFAYRRNVKGVPDAAANHFRAYEESVKEFESIKEDKLPNGKLISQIEFDSGTYEIKIKKSMSRYCKVVYDTLQNIIESGFLNKPIFGVKTTNSLKTKSYGFWIALEGIGGSGKTTQCRELTNTLKSLFPDQRIMVLDEFSNSSLGAFLKSRVPKKYDFRVHIKRIQKTSFLDTLLIIADRIQTLTDLANDDRDIIILDGFKWSLLAHAVALLTNGNADDVKQQLEHAVQIILSCFPKLSGEGITVFLDIPPEQAYRRLQNRTDSSLKSKHLEFLTKLASAYDTILKKHPEIYIVNATQSKPSITAEISKIVEMKLKNLKKNYG